MALAMHNVIIIVKDSFESGSNSALSSLMLSSFQNKNTIVTPVGGIVRLGTPVS